MAPNRLFRSPDPEDPASDPVCLPEDPPDQSNKIRALRAPTPRVGLGRPGVDVSRPGADASPPWVAPGEIKAIRERLRISQRQFAGWFGFSTATLRHWERGNRRPTGPALVLLAVIRDNPRVVLRTVRKARLLAPGTLPDIEPLKSYRAPPGFGQHYQAVRRRRRRSS